MSAPYGPFCSRERAQEIITGWGRTAFLTGQARDRNPFCETSDGFAWHNAGWDEAHAARPTKTQMEDAWLRANGFQVEP